MFQPKISISVAKARSTGQSCRESVWSFHSTTSTGRPCREHSTVSLTGVQTFHLDNCTQKARPFYERSVYETA